MDYTHFLLDAFVIIILILFAVLGAKKGIIRSVGDFAGSILAAWLASFCGQKSAEMIYTRFIQASLESKIAETVGSSAEGISSYFSSMSPFIVRWLENRGITEGGLIRVAESGNMNVAGVVEAAISPVFIGMARVFSVIVFFLIFVILIKVILMIIDGIFELPVLNTINALVGAVFSLFAGVVVVWVLIAAVQFFEPMMSISTRNIIDSIVNSSYIYRWVSELNPFAWIFS